MRQSLPAQCDHARTPSPVRPVPDWAERCPDCGEAVTHDRKGGFITVREVNDRLAERRRIEEKILALAGAIGHHEALRRLEAGG